jgi:mono/diheme cytochrome c family protein
MTMRVALVLVLLVFSLGTPACGGTEAGDDTTPATTATGETDSSAAGRSIFTDNCGSCHVLADAGTAGLVGPDLDKLSLTVEGVEQQVREGGGDMPAFEGNLSGEEIQDVAAYVVSAQRR